MLEKRPSSRKSHTASNILCALITEKHHKYRTEIRILPRVTISSRLLTQGISDQITVSSVPKCAQFIIVPIQSDLSDY